MKRILSILCCVLILGAMRLSAQTVEVTIDNIKYRCTGITAEVSGYGTKPVGGLVIPNEVTTDGNTYTVTSIGNEAFFNCLGLTSIELPASLTSIGNEAFSYCWRLTSVTSLRTTPIAISSNVFDDVSSKVLFIPEGEEALAAYWNAEVWKDFETIVQGKPIDLVINSIKYLCYENEAKVIGYETMPTGVLTIPNEVTTDGNTYTVTSIGNDAFMNCSGLTSIELPASLTSIGNYAFFSCWGLPSIELPALLTSIGNYAFYGCSELTSIELPASLTSIGEGAFELCSGLTSIELPASLTSIGNYAFELCSGLTSIELPALLTSIGNYAFRDCWELTSIELPASLTSIGNYAFFSCSGLTSIELPASLTSIGNSAFSGCSKLTSVISLRTTPIAISAGVFDDVSSKMLFIPEGGEALSAYRSAAVWRNFGTIVQGKPIAITVINGIKYSCSDTTAEVIGYETKPTGVLAIPREVTTGRKTYTVTSIGNSAFSYCSGLTSIELPASLTSIGNYAFYRCSGLTDIIYWGITEPLIGIGIVSSEIELWLPNASAGFTASNWNAHTIHYGSVPVSVSSLESEELRCYASQQEIVVTSSQNRPLTITNLYGVTIYSGKTIDGTTRVSVTQSGVYIVRVGLKSFKVAVQ